MNGFWVAAELDEAIAIPVALSADGVESVEQVAEQEAGGSVPGEGAFGNPSIDEHDENAAASGLPEGVGPEFGFDEDEDFRFQDAEGATDPRTAIDWIVDLLDAEREFASEFSHAGGGGGGNDKLEGGQAWFQGPDQEGGEVDLTDADGVNPDDAPICEGLLDAG